MDINNGDEVDVKWSAYEMRGGTKQRSARTLNASTLLQPRRLVGTAIADMSDEMGT